MLESRGECAEAQRLLGMIKSAFPEVLTAIKTKQLAQEILLNKEEHIGEVAKTGAIKRHCPSISEMPPSDKCHSCFPVDQDDLELIWDLCCLAVMQ